MIVPDMHNYNKICVQAYRNEQYQNRYASYQHHEIAAEVCTMCTCK